MIQDIIKITAIKMKISREMRRVIKVTIMILDITKISIINKMGTVIGKAKIATTSNISHLWDIAIKTELQQVF